MWFCRIFYRCVDWNILFVHVVIVDKVASFTDAWIETNRYEWKRIFTASHLLQMRGLKHYSPTYGMASTSRIFYRCVDWNIARKNRKIFEIVASFTDAWIETLICNHCGLSISSHLLQMRGLKLDKEKGKEDAKRRIFYRCVDWNVDLLSEDEKKIGRIFYRCVDWNKVLLMRRLLPRVASFTDAWIETYFRRREQYLKSRIFYRCVDWNRAYEAIYNAYIRSHLLQMRGLKLWRGEHSNGYYVSHLLQMRGLKQGVVTNINIKTSRIFYRCVDWNSFLRSNWA